MAGDVSFARVSAAAERSGTAKARRQATDRRVGRRWHVMSRFRPRVKAKNEMRQMKMVGNQVVAIALMVAVGATG
ncbi:hypothetical protein CR51_42140 [Caballeronia megalochromosomata]|nr:hypothetical protein CR51_42140 [Caballeronia megalochromosomata]